MPNPHIDQVRQSLLDTLADLRNKEQPMDIERAKAVATVASVLVDTAKVENEYLKITGQDRSNFLETPPDDILGIPRIDGPAAHNPFPNVVRHRLQG
jgi:hypothetical protein